MGHSPTVRLFGADSASNAECCTCGLNNSAQNGHKPINSVRTYLDKHPECGAELERGHSA